MEKQAKIDLLMEMVSIRSENECETEVAQCIQKRLDAIEVSSRMVEFSKGRDNLIAEIGAGDKVLALSGHMDVVPVGKNDSWRTSPYVPHIKEGKLYGRGTTDMKSGLAAMTCAMVELVEEGVKLNGQVRLLATVAEETGLLGAHQLASSGFVDDVDALIIGEPSGGRIVFAEKGIVNYTVVSHGKSAHSSLPELGVNAIDNLMKFYNAMMNEFSKLNEANATLGPMTYCNSLIQGGVQANVVPDSASFTANIRTIPEVDNEKVIAAVSRIVDCLNESSKDMNLELTIDQNDPPVFTDAESQLMNVAQDELKNQGIDPVLLGVPGATDAAAFIAGNAQLQIIILGPGNESLHQENEYVEIEDYLAMCELYKRIASSYLA